jgi:TPR repeat protein
MRVFWYFLLMFQTSASAQPTFHSGLAVLQQPAGNSQSFNKPRVFFESASHGSNQNASRNQSMEMSKDFEQDCPGAQITISRQMADYTVALNHIEVGLIVRDNQVQVADRNGDLIAKTKEGGSIGGNMKQACEVILSDWTKFHEGPPEGTPTSSLSVQSGDAPRPLAVVAAEIEVRSKPDGADILLDDAFVGNTPSTIGVSAGDHAIAIKKSGFKTWRRNVRVTTGKITLTAELESGIDPPQPQEKPTVTGHSGGVASVSPVSAPILSARDAGDWSNVDFTSVQTAASDGDVRAQFEIGNRYYLGQRGAGKDYSQALTWYRKAAALNNEDAEVNLGLMYAQGQGVQQDFAQALVWYRKAADQGLASAQNNIGALYYRGQGVAQDYAQARVWFMKAADQGYAPAQTSVGGLYLSGLGVLQDYEQAATWIRKAADQGDASAQNNLGGLYYNGQGVRQDYGQALIWFRKGADQGDAGAAGNLGILYENGQGVPRDLVQARMWYQKAADQGNAAAKKRLVALAGQN